MELKNGRASYDWLPIPKHEWPGIHFSTGHSVTPTVAILSETSGIAIVENDEKR